MKQDKFEDLNNFIENNKMEEEQIIDITDKVLKMHNVLKEKGLYNFDLKPGNVMINKAGDIKLIDYEGMVPEDGNKIVVTYKLPIDSAIIQAMDKEFHSGYYEYVKWWFLIDVLKYSNKIDTGTDKKLQEIFPILKGYKKTNVETKIKALNDFLSIFYKLNKSNKFSKYLKEVGFDANKLNGIKNVVIFSREYLNKAKTGDVIEINDKKFKVLPKKTEINKKLFEKKEKNSAYRVNNIVINKSNKLVELYNYKLIEKRKKGDYFNPICWYYSFDKSGIIYDDRVKDFMSIMQEKGTVLQEIVDDLIPIDETNIFQRIVLGTLIIRFIAEERKNIKTKNDNEQSQVLYNILNDDNIKKYFGKDAFKKVFMEIIDADKILLDSFFDFKAECEVIPQNDNNFKLKFKSSELELNLSKEEADKLIKKFDPKKLYDKRFDYEKILEKEYNEKEKVSINLNILLMI